MQHIQCLRKKVLWPGIEPLDEFPPVVGQFGLDNNLPGEILRIDGPGFELPHGRRSQPSLFEFRYAARQAESLNRVAQFQQHATEIEQNYLDFFVAGHAHL